MRFRIFQAALGLSLTAAELSAQPIKFDLVERHQIVVRGSIGPLQGLKFLIDTGAMPGMLDRKIAKKLALPVEDAEVVAFGRRTRVATSVLPGIQVGNFHAEAVAIGVGDLSFLHGVDAIIGLDLLSRGSFRIDYEHRQLEFGPMPGGAAGLPLEATPPFLTVQLTFSGQRFRFIVDTGSGGLVLFEKRVGARLPFLGIHGESVMYHLGGSTRLRRVSLPPADAGGTTFPHIEGSLSDQSVDGYPAGIDGVLGLRVLAWKHAGFDFERNRLVIE